MSLCKLSHLHKTSTTPGGSYKPPCLPSLPRGGDPAPRHRYPQAPRAQHVRSLLLPGVSSSGSLWEEGVCFCCLYFGLAPPEQQQLRPGHCPGGRSRGGEGGAGRLPTLLRTKDGRRRGELPCPFASRPPAPPLIKFVWCLRECCRLPAWPWKGDDSSSERREECV